MKKIVNILIICVFLLLETNVFAVDGQLRPVSNVFVLNPGVASPKPAAANLNFGGSGAMCVSSPLARAYEPNEGIDHQPKGEFITLLKFDSAICSQTIINNLTLSLAITNGNQSAGNIFNYRGHAGEFDVYWIVSNWSQGNGTPVYLDNTGLGVTYNSLASILGQTSAVYLDTFYYDARYSYAEGEKWFTFDFDLSNGYYAEFLNAIQSGQTITLMLAAPQDSDTCFNLRAYIQYNQNGTFTYRDTGPIIAVSAELPFTDIDFDHSGTVDTLDLFYITDNWLVSGSGMAADISPLGGDGRIDFMDFAVFAKYWQMVAVQ